MSGISTGILWAVIQQIIKSIGTITAAKTDTETETETFMQERTRELILYVDDMNPLIGGGGRPRRRMSQSCP